MDTKNSMARVQPVPRAGQRRRSLPYVFGGTCTVRNRTATGSGSGKVSGSSSSSSSSLSSSQHSSPLNPSSEPIVSTNSWSRYAQTSAADYARTDKHAGNIFRNFYAVGYQRHRRLISSIGGAYHRTNKFASSSVANAGRKHPSTCTSSAATSCSSIVIAVFHLIMKLRERVVICFGITFVLFTLILVIDFQYEIGYGGHRFFMPMRHGRVQMLDETGAGASAGASDRSVYRTFQNKYAGGGAPAGSDAYEDTFDDGAALSGNLTEMHDCFKDLVPYAGQHDDLDTDDPGRKVVIVVYEYREEQPSLSEYINFDAGANETLQVTFHKRISKRQMYRENDALVEAILKDLRSRKIVHVREKEGGTQLKLVIHYDSGEFALFKPMRFPREQQTLPNHFYFTDYERHNAEIAAFHLDRLLGFRRSMPVSGRLLNLTSEFYKIADAELLKTFFVSPANNLCFHGHCSYYCDTSHAICGNPDRVEGSFAAFLPEKQVADRTLRKHPWRRSYHKRRKALWETEPNYCDAVKRTPPYNRGILLLDLVDTSMFDFLMGNMDRHHFETFAAFGNDTFPLHLDHGRGFGRPFHDELTILAPLTQCCIVKQSTLKMLLGFHNGEKKLSHHMRESLQKDPLNPILWEPHFAALDRRVKIILEAIRECLRQARESGSEALSGSAGSADVTPQQ